MRIGVDGYNLAMARGTGVASYGVELVNALHRMGHGVDGIFGLSVPRDPSLRETALFDAFKRSAATGVRANRYQRAWRLLRAFSRPPAYAVPLSPNVDKRAFAEGLPAFDRIISRARLFEDAFVSFKLTGRFVQLQLPDPPDVMHWTYPVPVTLKGSQNIYTLHDLVPLKLPYTTMDNKAVYGRVVARCVETASQICTISESSRNDIVARYAIDSDRVTNTYQAYEIPKQILDTDPEEDASAIEGIFGLNCREYFLYFGAIEPKKNVGRIIESYLSLRTKTPLVIVGARAWQSEQELRLMPGDGANGSPGIYLGHRGQTIVRLDYLPQDLLFKLIRGAKAVIFPSLYEGFGLPVLEAMQLGTPVITSKVSSLPEVAGDAGLLVDPYDVGSIMEALRQIDEDTALADQMIARGYRQAMLFAPDRYDQRLTELYRVAMSR